MGVDFPSNKDAAACVCLCASQKTLVYFWSGSSVMTESFLVIPESLRFSSLMGQLSNDTPKCEIAFLPGMSNNCLGEEIIAQGILASQNPQTKLPIISGLVLVAQTVHFCGLLTVSWHHFVAGNKRKHLKPSTREAQRLPTPSECFGQKYGICLAVRKLKNI